MRRLTNKLSALPVILLLFVPPPAARTQTGRQPIDAIQPTDSSRELILLSRPGWARVREDGATRRIALRPQEMLTAIAETPSGWIAAGVRAEEDGSKVFLVSSDTESGARFVAPPQRDPLQLRPVLLVHDGRLEGVAWLEGEGQSQLSVRFAAWNGIGWGRPRVISRPGPGSQTGLTGATLRNGNLLLAWSRFDGTDDEIYWSLGDGAIWSKPVRVGTDNRTPDITPVVASSHRGARLVWGRMVAGEYFLVEKTFGSGEWLGERVISGPGSVFPSLVRSDDRLLALYRTALPLGWGVTDLDGASSIARKAHLAASRPQRPVLRELQSTGPILEWLRPDGLATLRWSTPHE
ncbi:MAG: hypothetical protein ACE5GX_03875 [Thermoanaerobaculia bacterium]